MWVHVYSHALWNQELIIFCCWVLWVLIYPFILLWDRVPLTQNSLSKQASLGPQASHSLALAIETLTTQLGIFKVCSGGQTWALNGCIAKMLPTDAQSIGTGVLTCSSSYMKLSLGISKFYMYSQPTLDRKYSAIKLSVLNSLLTLSLSEVMQCNKPHNIYTVLAL